MQVGKHRLVKALVAIDHGIKNLPTNVDAIDFNEDATIKEGPRILTKDFSVYPGDEKLCKGDFKKALDSLKEREKQYVRRAQIQVFNDGRLGPILQNVRARTMLIRMGGMRGQE